MKYLFIDRKYVQRIDGVRQVFHQPVKEKAPVLKPERPWESDSLLLWNAPIWCEERSRWRMWYAGGPTLPLYAESEDGLNWERPSLGLVSWEGSTDNNIINLGFTAKTPKENHLVLVRDDHETDPSRRFKGLTYFSPELAPLVSADGLDWTLADGKRIPSGDQFRLGYDEINRRFVATVKLGGMIGEGQYPVAEYGRAASLSVSEDFVHWSEPVLVMWGDEIDQQLGKARVEEAFRNPDRRSPLIVKSDQYFTDIYNMPMFTYEDMYLALPTLFNQCGRWWFPIDPASGKVASNQEGILYPTLVSSRDLYNWDRLSREPFIPLSPLSNKESWDYGAIDACPPVRNGDELWFYYNGNLMTHIKNEMVDPFNLRESPNDPLRGIFLARMRIDGFVSLYADADPGVVLTTPIKVTGRKLYVNTDASRGELRAELRDARTGRVITGYSLGEYVAPRAVISEDGQISNRLGTGARFHEDSGSNDTVPICENSTAVAVSWTGGDDLSELIGREVRVQFCLKNAHLYSFWFGD